MSYSFTILFANCQCNNYCDNIEKLLIYKDTDGKVFITFLAVLLDIYFINFISLFLKTILYRIRLHNICHLDD